MLIVIYLLIGWFAWLLLLITEKNLDGKHLGQAILTLPIMMIAWPFFLLVWLFLLVILYIMGKFVSGINDGVLKEN